MWSMARGADGHVYLGLCLEGSGGGVAQLYRYNVTARKLEHLLDMGEVTGEPADNGHAAQGKIHFSLCPVSDGTIYGATHCTTPPKGHKYWNPYGMWDDPFHSFRGAHIFHYDPRTGKAVDFGIIYPNEGLPYLLLDETRGRLYGITYPKAHFFRLNLACRDLVDYGRVSSWYPIAASFDTRGNLFLGDTNSRLLKYDVAQDRLVFFDSAPYSHPWNSSMRYSWLCNLDRADDGRIYGTHYMNDHVYRFDPEQETPVFEDLGPGLPDSPARQVRALVPDGHGHLYYVVMGNGNILVRYTIKTGEREVLGRLQVGGADFWSWLSVLDRDGNLYMMGPRNPMSLAIYRPKG